MKTTLIAFIFQWLFFMSINSQDLPFRQIPDYPEAFTPATVAARMIDGLGFRYYWATEGLRTEDLAYRTGEGARTVEETAEHILLLSELIHHAVMGEVNRRPAEPVALSFVEMREKTLDYLRVASEALHGKELDLQDLNMRYQRGARSNEFPFWNVLNGPLADALWHTGQIVAFRRAAGNPIDPGVNVFLGIRRGG